MIRFCNLKTPQATRGFAPSRRRVLKALERTWTPGLPPDGAETRSRLRYWEPMDPARKRRVRLVVALSAAVLLAGALIYTSFSASSEARSPSQLLARSDASHSYQLTGTVVKGSIKKDGGTTIEFKVRDRTGSAAVPVKYTGSVA